MKLNKLKEIYDAEFGFDLFRTDRKRQRSKKIELKSINYDNKKHKI